MTQVVQLVVNGESTPLPTPATVAELVRMRGPRPPFAVELNRRLVRHGEYEQTPLNGGDRVEIVTLVGGG